MIAAIKHQECMDACLDCVAVCNYCAYACLQEEEVDRLRKCVQLNLECAAVCEAAATLMSLNSENVKEICQVCAEVCERCADECDKHDNDHCEKCAEACRKCAELCRAM